MARRAGVARLDRGDRGLHEALEELADRLVEAAVGERHGRLRGERPGELLVPGVEGADHPLGLLRRAEDQREIRLAVDELERADGLALRRPHGHDEHGLRAVTVLLVERAVDRERRAGRRRVRVGEVQDLAGERDVAGDALAREGQARRAERDRHAVVLGEREAELARAVGRLVDQVDRAGVALRDLARLRQDRLEELARISLGGEPDPDRVQLRQLPVEAGDLGRALGVGERVFHRAREDGVPRALRHQRVPVAGPGAGRRGVHQTDDAHVAALGRREPRVLADEDHRRRGGARDGFGRELGGLEAVGEQRDGRRRGARGRVVEDTPTHGTSLGLALARSQESASPATITP